MTELADIKIAPSAGERTKLHVANTPAANAIAKMLYPAAHQRFCTIYLYVARLSDTMRGTSRDG